MELLKSIIKTVVVGTIAWLVMRKVLPQLPLLVSGRPEIQRGLRALGFTAPYLDPMIA